MKKIQYKESSTLLNQTPVRNHHVLFDTHGQANKHQYLTSEASKDPSSNQGAAYPRISPQV